MIEDILIFFALSLVVSPVDNSIQVVFTLHLDVRVTISFMIGMVYLQTAILHVHMSNCITTLKAYHCQYKFVRSRIYRQ